jgi:threonine dehydrogenase-like Zn-dependent dehydrogenase
LSQKPAIAFVTGSGKVEMVTPPEVGRPGPDEVLVSTELVGFCGTDREIIHGGVAVHPDEDLLILGHEMVGTVVEMGSSVAGFEAGQRVVPMVRLPCSSCGPCRVGRSDFCLTGEYREYGITRMHGFARPSVVVPASALLPVPAELGHIAVLAEPLSIVEKTFDQAHGIMARVPGRDLNGDRWGRGLRAVIAGAGSIGSLSAYLAVELGFVVDVLDVRDVGSLAAQLAVAAGANYIALDPDEPAGSVAADLQPADVIIEATGSPHLGFALINSLARGGVLMWVGVAAEEHQVTFEGSEAVLRAVLQSNAIVGTVNSSRDHFERALNDLVVLSEKQRFNGLLTDVVPVDRFEEAIWPQGDAIKQAVSFREET